MPPEPTTSYLFVDVGSTFTKLAVVDPHSGRPLAAAQAPTTVEDDVETGFASALGQIDPELRERLGRARMSSSAAGGLRIASVGLTAALSGRAARIAALGSGAKVVCELSGRLGAADLDAITRADPHIVLLTGGLDGGDGELLVANATALATLEALPAVIVAGNRDAAARAAEALTDPRREVRMADNVFPEPGRAEIEATRRVVVELFIGHIARAKGLDRLAARLATTCEPTPLVVSRGVETIAQTAGEVVVVDLGGATTDVHSAGGEPSPADGARPADPTVSRTVEGDVGMRAGARGTVEASGTRWRDRVAASLGCDIEVEASRREARPSLLASDDRERAIDAELARAAVAIALQRHAGRVVVRHNAWGDRYRIEGRDLRRARSLICTGGIFRHLPQREELVRGALADARGAMVPVAPRIVFDDSYTLFAAGLAAGRDEPLAQRICARLLTEASPRAAR